MSKHQIFNAILQHVEFITKRGEFNSESILNHIQLIYLYLYKQRINGLDNTNNTYTIEQLQTLIDRYRDMPCYMMGGNWDLIWLLGRLIKDDLIEVPEFMWNMVYEILARYSSYLVNTPYKVDLRQRFYPVGVCMMSLHNQIDTLERYVWEEQIIFKLCDCEKFITQGTPNIYNPNMLNAGIVHSVMAFSDLSIRNNIYPYKALQIKQIASELTLDDSQSNISDILILRLSRHQTINDYIINMSKNEILQFLSDIGTLSVIYENGSIFEQAIAECNIVHPNILSNLTVIPNHYILGIALGLLNIINNYEV